MTLKEQLDRHHGVGPGFDLLRLLLAVAIFYGHAFWAAGNTTLPEFTGIAAGVDAIGAHWQGWRRPPHVALVPTFFALSGFLVAGSAIRLRQTANFLVFRSLRIFPALTVEVVLSAFVLGPIFTVMSLTAYFSDLDFIRYLGNILGFVHFELPGVFLANPSRVVNTNLWTLPAEFYCYLITSVLMVSGIAYNRNVFTALFCGVSVVLIAASFVMGYGITETIFPTSAIVYCFFCGYFIYLWRDKMPAGYLFFFAVSAASYLLLLSNRTVFIAPIFIAAATAIFGSWSIPKISFLSKGDYSYGIYLYGCPISQALIAAFPAFRGHGWWVLAVGAPLTILFAAASWHFIEKPTLGLKRRLAATRSPLGSERAREAA